MQTYSEKQLHIMDVATDLFAEHGFTRTSVREIAEAAGVNVAMISYYFGSKEQLLEALFDLNMSKKEEKWEIVYNNKKASPVEKVRMLIEGVVSSIFDNLKFNQIQVRQTTIEIDRNSPIFSKIVAFRKRSREKMQLVIEEGQNIGVFKKNVDVILLSCVFIGTINHAITNTPYYSELYNIPEDDRLAYRKNFLNKLTNELISIITIYLTHDVES